MQRKKIYGEKVAANKVCREKSFFLQENAWNSKKIMLNGLLKFGKNIHA